MKVSYGGAGEHCPHVRRFRGGGAGPGGAEYKGKASGKAWWAFAPKIPSCPVMGLELQGF